MPVITCMICGSTAAQSLDINICTRCLHMGNDKIKILAIKKYLEKYPDTKFDDIIKFLHIDRADLKRFIKNGDVVLIQDNIRIPIPENNSKVDKRREQFKKQLTNFSYTSPSSNTSPASIESQLVIDLLKKKNQGKLQEK